MYKIIENFEKKGNVGKWLLYSYSAKQFIHFRHICVQLKMMMNMKTTLILLLLLVLIFATESRKQKSMWLRLFSKYNNYNVILLSVRATFCMYDARFQNYLDNKACSEEQNRKYNNILK